MESLARSNPHPRDEWSQHVKNLSKDLPQEAHRLVKQLRDEPAAQEALLERVLLRRFSNLSFFEMEHLRFLQITVDLHQSTVSLLHYYGLNSERMAKRIFDHCWQKHDEMFVIEFNVEWKCQLEEKVDALLQSYASLECLAVVDQQGNNLGLIRNEHGKPDLGPTVDRQSFPLQIRALHLKTFPSFVSVQSFCNQVIERLHVLYSAIDGKFKQPVLDEARLKEFSNDLMDHLFMKHPCLEADEHWSLMIRRALSPPTNVMVRSCTGPLLDNDVREQPAHENVQTALPPAVQIDPPSCRCFFGYFSWILPYVEISRQMLPSLMSILVCWSSSTFQRGIHVWAALLQRMWRRFTWHLFLVTPMSRFCVKTLLFLVWLVGPRIFYWKKDETAGLWDKFCAVVFNTQITTEEGYLLDTAKGWFWLFCAADLWVQTAEVIHFCRARALNGAVGSMDISMVPTFLRSRQGTFFERTDGAESTGEILAFSATGSVLLRPHNPFFPNAEPLHEHSRFVSCLRYVFQHHSGAHFAPSLNTQSRSFREPVDEDFLREKFSLNPCQCMSPCKCNLFRFFYDRDPRPGMWLMLELVACACRFGQGITANDDLKAFAEHFHKPFAIVFAFAHSLQMIKESAYISQLLDNTERLLRDMDNGHDILPGFSNCAIRLIMAYSSRLFLKRCALFTAYIFMGTTALFIVTFASDFGGETHWAAMLNARAEFCLATAVVAQNIIRFVCEFHCTRVQRLVRITSGERFENDLERIGTE